MSPLRFRAPHALVVLIALGLAGCGRSAGPPNIVLIFADDLGYGDLGVYGHPTIQTPRLDSLASAGIKLTSFYVTTAACSPSRAGLLTGRYPVRSGLTRVLGPDDRHGLSAEEVTLAEALREQGYRTHAIGKWHLGAVDGFYPTQQGFDSYYGLLYSNDMKPPWVQTQRPLRLHRDREEVDEYPVDQGTLTERYAEEAVRLIRDRDERPFFIYLAPAMPHLPIVASERFRGRSAGGLYGDVIETIDWSVGRIVQVLREEGLLESTIVIFTSDNGPWTNMPPRMYETEEVERWHAGSAGPLRGSKGTTWEGGVRVPGIVAWKGRLPAGRVSAELATTMDLYTTLVELAGGSVPSDRVVDGRNILPLLDGTGEVAPQPFFYVIEDRLEAVRDGDWKLRLLYRGEEPPQVELFNLADDPYEAHNRAEERPDVVERLAGLMAAFAGETGAGFVGPL